MKGPCSFCHPIIHSMLQFIVLVTSIITISDHQNQLLRLAFPFAITFRVPQTVLSMQSL
ncbi:hypothetical protein ACE6H2_003324 [Prunus campanulata]